MNQEQSLATQASIIMSPSQTGHEKTFQMPFNAVEIITNVSSHCKLWWRFWHQCIVPLQTCTCMPSADVNAIQLIAEANFLTAEAIASSFHLK